MKKRIIIPILLLLIIIVSLLLLPKHQEKKEELKEVPRLDINLNDSLTLKTINKNDKSIKYENNELIFNDKKYNVTIKGRGHGTWKPAKKAYQISFDNKTSLYNFNSKKYNLLANYYDPSLLKNDFTFTIAKRMDVKYTNTGEYIDLYVNDQYIGNYYLIPKINISESSVNLKDNNAIIMELDNNYYEGETYFISKYFEDYLTIKDRSSNTNKGFTSFQEKYNLMEQNIQNKNYQWLKENIDIDSFIKYYIITNFSKNPDGYRSSLYFYMDGIDDKIHIGAVWDFDIAYDYLDNDPQNNSIIQFEDNAKTSILFDELLKIDEFREELTNYWSNTACNIYKEEINNLDNKIEYLKESGEKNSIFWNGKHYNQYTDSLKDWLNKRYNYYNELYTCK